MNLLATVPPPSRSYWRLQLIGWALYGVFGVVGYTMFTQKFAGYIVVIQVVVAATMVGLSHGLRYIIRRYQWVQLPLLGVLWRLLLINALLSVLSQVIIWTITLLVVLPLMMPGGKPQSWGEFVGYALNVNFVLWLWSVVYFGLHYLRSYRQAEVDKWKLAAAVREAEMQTLKAQINPHFLFNGLNNIRSLIGEDPEQARHMLSHLSELLRYAIQLNRTEQVPLGKELAVVQDYLQLESLQLEERLRYTIDVPADCLGVQVPPMLVQVLVENAIKHGLAQLPAGGELRVQARCAAGELLLSVENTGQLSSGPAKADGTGTGLRNARERLRLLFGPRAELRLEQATPDTVAARLRLPVVINEQLAMNNEQLPTSPGPVPLSHAPALGAATPLGAPAPRP
ncbi:sensor histidine kinase [Hymenobacter latericus]|uniref:sensor histidine kinase n=1 Tax=Hymenobacter sp. YIM 151858-1 TaxID=2987688 RepID=UPI0022264A17|nr:histidine kinase [Hymenobacter sp. YIM 151858-1]UYZ60864.1 histidine kinase [Hymenobacter sp. YIM 151858-1]